MKKISKILIPLLCLILLCGCDIYVYDIGDNTSNNLPDSSENLSQSGTGTTIITNNINYSGFINFTSKEPNPNNSWDEIYDAVKTSVVTIRNIFNGKKNAQGSGVFFAEDNTQNGHAYIYTNAHVVQGSSSIEVLLSNGVLVEGTLIGYDENEDVAVIQVQKRTDYTIATLRHTDTLKIGEEVLAIGTPVGEKFSGTATSGIISNVNIAVSNDDSNLDLYLIQIDASLNPGNSGGPLFDKSGNLIGINNLKLLTSGTTTNIESFNYSIPISHFSLVANYLLQGTSYHRPYINITIADVRLLTMNERQHYGVTVSNGLLLEKISEQSALYGKATTNQIITHIQGKKILKSGDFSVELLKYAPGDTITLTICNGDGTNSRNVDITLLKR